MMAKIILGIFIGAGIALSWVSIIEKEEQKKIDRWNEWKDKLP